MFKNIVVRYCLFLIAINCLPSCDWTIGDSGSADRFTVFCDVERISEDRLLAKDDQGFHFKGAALRSQVESRSGEYSLALNESNQYGFSLKIKSPRSGERYQASVYYKSDGPPGHLIASNDNFWHKAETAGPIDSSGWQKLFLDIYIPPNNEGDEFTIYAWNAAAETVYFDDLTVAKADPKMRRRLLFI